MGAGEGFSFRFSLAGLTLGMGWLSSSEKVTCVAAPRLVPGLVRGSGLALTRPPIRSMEGRHGRGSEDIWSGAAQEVKGGAGVQVELVADVLQADEVRGGEAAPQGMVRNLWKLACSCARAPVSGEEAAMSPLLSPKMRAAAHSSLRRLEVSREARRW